MGFSFLHNAKIKPKDADKAAESGGLLPKGKYHAELISHADKEVGGKSVDELKFKILGGPYRGRIVRTDLFQTGNDEEKTELNRKQLCRFGEKLGVLQRTPDEEGYIQVIEEGFSGAIGAQVIIDVDHQVDKDDKSKAYPRVKMFGIYALGEKGTEKVILGEEASSYAGVPDQSQDSMIEDV